ncbi:MAG TPA: bifunctional adenosylcobinamide kinase/adenosylcobinamide-phosphate guanylyltransferase [Microvirga sp.]|nr:bifunctional adenosylcobinamide kinase/adenosylcobinamide-phosphate guanylyltransferase [Microvirga sp.]
MSRYRRVLVLGGARSGKSRYALELAAASGLERVLIATAQPGDDEMRARIDRHRRDRSGAWRTDEEPLDLPAALARQTGPGRIVVVECLTLWLSNLLLAGRDPERAAEALVAAVAAAAGPLVLVSNEVGHGIVPATPLGRAFRDEQGRLNQQAAAACDAVVLVTAGCPALLKPAPALSLRLG